MGLCLADTRLKCNYHQGAESNYLENMKYVYFCDIRNHYESQELDQSDDNSLESA